MKPFSILLIRILAIYLAIKPLIAMSPLLFSANLDAELHQWLPGVVATVFIPVLAGIVLWFGAGALATKIYGPYGVETSVQVNEAGLVRAGSFLIGVYLFVQHTGTALSQWAWGGIIDYGSLVVIALGSGLIVGTSLIGKLYNKIKYAGGDV
ncbi:hypothetical protein [Vreelandella arcis]|uniref:Uncharacterized protein n=1 Tax=Vreelandella arcis TaxID=416873 RepID=A0A1H0GKD5_9GAMM|nr:hypothetical protein [Halomonas arcis]SDO07324.1 hypothetical protein SAMN04487951_11269 [Halomonas arcis]